MHLRPYSPADTARLAALYQDSITHLAPGLYTPQEIAAWAHLPRSLSNFGKRLAKGRTWIAIIDDEPAAFAQLDETGHVSFLYCRPDHARKGLATALHDRLEAEARAAGFALLRTEASRVSRPFFEKQGYRLDAAETIRRLGVDLERFRMHKPLL